MRIKNEGDICVEYLPLLLMPVLYKALVHTHQHTRKFISYVM